ncbi:MAG: DUF5658 family protein [Gammaproteobacteria bacterium]|nr:DUF5658 family protein [Gammaproteobacteria bacterium]MDH5694105.1 DUF5658 family protein [Gammaproteobacteria bacterium]
MLEVKNSAKLNPEVEIESKQESDAEGKRYSGEEDRRKAHIRAGLHSLTGKGRRKSIRRDGDTLNGLVVDHHEPKLFFITVAILLLCIADAFFTLTILNMGGEEVNPVMKALLDTDVLLFFVIKFFLTAVFLVVTIVYKHFKILNLVSGYHLIVGIFSVYITLIFYELYLIYLAI